MELVRAGLRHGHDRSARQLVELSAVVGGDDLVFLNRQLRERIALAAVRLTGLTAADVALLADTVDKDIDRVRRIGARAEGRRTVRGDVEDRAGDRVGELEEVTRQLRNRLDLLQRDDVRDLRGLHFEQATAAHHHGVE